MTQELLNITLPKHKYPSVQFECSRKAANIEEEFKLSVVNNQNVGDVLGDMLFELSPVSAIAPYELKRFRICNNLSEKEVHEFINYALMTISEKAREVRLNDIYGIYGEYDAFCKYNGDIKASYLAEYYKCYSDNVFVYKTSVKKDADNNRGT